MRVPAPLIFNPTSAFERKLLLINVFVGDDALMQLLEPEPTAVMSRTTQLSTTAVQASKTRPSQETLAPSPVPSMDSTTQFRIVIVWAAFPTTPSASMPDRRHLWA